MPPILGRRCSGRSGSASSRTNLLAVWSWTIATGKIGTAFQMLAGFAPCEVWSTYPLLLSGEAALELPGASEHPGYPLALAVARSCHGHPGRRRSLRSCVRGKVPADQLGPDGSPGR